jgi:hypothetical protein
MRAKDARLQFLARTPLFTLYSQYIHSVDDQKNLLVVNILTSGVEIFGLVLI